MGKNQDAQEVKSKLTEMKYHKRNLQMVLNLDYDKPSPKMIEKAKQIGIDPRDEASMAHFKLA
jgi:hypothetical protein